MKTPITAQWHWQTLDKISGYDFYQIAKLRQDIFIIEQSCVFADLDDLDPITHHLLVKQHNILIAYLRVLPPINDYDPVYFSRVSTAITHRHQGIGYQLIQAALDYIRQQFPGHEIVISAQAKLINLYTKFGFECIGAPYTEDEIPHVAMRLML